MSVGYTEMTNRIIARLEEHGMNTRGNLILLNLLTVEPEDQDEWAHDEWESELNELADEADDYVAIVDLWDLTEGYPGLRAFIRARIVSLIEKKEL